MVPAKRTLVIVALTTTLVSCSNQAVPATTPTMPTQPLRIYATTATLPLAIDLTTAYIETHPRSTFTTHTASYQTMLDLLFRGGTPYFFTTHLSSDALWVAPIGQDGIAIIVHQDVEIDGLNTEQLREIYQGRLTNWLEVGGNDQEIIVYSRESGSGTRAEFERMIMGKRETTPNALVASSSENMIALVIQTPGSIGYVSTGYLDNTVHAVEINGVSPTLDTIANHRYPLRSTIFIMGLSEPQGDYRLFVGWLQSPDGQAIVAKRYAPLN